MTAMVEHVRARGVGEIRKTSFTDRTQSLTVGHAGRIAGVHGDLGKRGPDAYRRLPVHGGGGHLRLQEKRET